ncbi:OCIA domain-containing protein 1-like [Antennarius striatus]|uniref:OCIA domain-containing protein 1-like n=1 Tax=Antennarius striatus TaxID=241820 RepID=UPI0035AFEB44
MSSSGTSLTEDRRNREAPTPLGRYVLTENERKLLEECSRESFWRRSAPFAVIGGGVTRILVAKGILSSHPRFGAHPKVLFAALFGYLAGKISYMNICVGKLKRLENSPLGEKLKQRAELQAQYGPKSEVSDTDSQLFESGFQSADAPSQRSHNTEPFTQMAESYNLSVPNESYVENEEPKKKAVRYEDLRLKNRENYEVTLSQKAETPLNPSPEKETIRQKKEVKNIYGDTWEA